MSDLTFLDIITTPVDTYENILIVFPDGENIICVNDEIVMESSLFPFGNGISIKDAIKSFIIDESSYKEHIGKKHSLKSKVTSRSYGNRDQMSFYNDNQDLVIEILNKSIKRYFKDKDNFKRFAKFIKEMEYGHDKYSITVEVPPKYVKIIGRKYKVINGALQEKSYPIRYLEVIFEVHKKRDSTGVILLINILGYTNPDLLF